MKQLNWYQIFGKSNIPDGRTVLPTDDIQIWLHCANIWDKTYTTLAEVLADTDTLSALIASENAVDYMVRSTTWAAAVALIPTMTDDTHPSGECIAPSYSEGQEAYKAFDNDLSTTWSSSYTNPNYDGSNYIGYHFDKKIKCTVARFTQRYLPGYSPVVVASMKYQGSNDGVTWTDISSAKNIQITTLSTQVADDTALNVSGGYSYYRAVYLSRVSGNTGVYPTCAELQFYSGITQDSAAMTLIGLNNYCANTLLADSTWKTAICQSEYKGSVLNVQIPKMTSDSTPSGSCVASRVATGSSAYLAFDGNDATYWQSGGSGTGLKNISYTFPSAVTAICMDLLITTGNHLKDFSITNENSETLLTATSPNNSAKQTYILTNPTNSRKYQLNCTSDNYSGNQYTDINTLQFYGREDV